MDDREKIAENLRIAERAIESYKNNPNDPRANDEEYFTALTALHGKLQRELEKASGTLPGNGYPTTAGTARRIISALPCNAFNSRNCRVKLRPASLQIS